MRLTHFVKLDQDERSTQASFSPEAHAAGDASIRISQDADTPGGPVSIVWLTLEEHDAITDLVWSHRPDPVEDAVIMCGATLATTNTIYIECALIDGHANPHDEDAGPNLAGGYHVTRDGTLFAVPAMPF